MHYVNLTRVFRLFILALFASRLIWSYPPDRVIINPEVKYLIVFIGDGQGINHLLAANAYSGVVPQYQKWDTYWVTTYPSGGNYDPSQAWTDFSYVTQGATDSAAAATALFTGEKTANGRIAVSHDGTRRLFSVTDIARLSGKAIGAVSSVFISHATPGAWLAHNYSRNNGYAIADESLWGDPNTTGTPFVHLAYSGGRGNSLPAVDVIIGSGHPGCNGGVYINTAMRDKLFTESGLPGAFTFVERISGSPDAGQRLLDAANFSGTLRLAGLFGGPDGNLEYCLADGTGCNPENPTLEEMTQAALTVLNRDPEGFTLLVESGAIDWAAHDNNMKQMIGEVLQFNMAIQNAVDWVDNADSPATWQNTLMIITADHETGYLTAAPGIFPDQPLGIINATTLAYEKTNIITGRRASWMDSDGDSEIDPSEEVYWSWNTSGHTNSLVPLFVKGAGAVLFSQYAVGSDPLRGAYLDNTEVFQVMDAVLPLYRLYIPTLWGQQPAH